jgi:hypothetical protein
MCSKPYPQDRQTYSYTGMKAPRTIQKNKGTTMGKGGQSRCERILEVVAALHGPTPVLAEPFRTHGWKAESSRPEPHPNRGQNGQTERRDEPPQWLRQGGKVGTGGHGRVLWYA